LDIGEKVRNSFTRENCTIEGIQGIPPQNTILICNLQVQCTLRFCSAGCLKPEKPMHASKIKPTWKVAMD